MCRKVAFLSKHLFSTFNDPQVHMKKEKREGKTEEYD